MGRRERENFILVFFSSFVSCTGFRSLWVCWEFSLYWRVYVRLYILSSLFLRKMVRTVGRWWGADGELLFRCLIFVVVDVSNIMYDPLLLFSRLGAYIENVFMVILKRSGVFISMIMTIFPKNKIVDCGNAMYLALLFMITWYSLLPLFDLVMMLTI